MPTDAAAGCDVHAYRRDIAPSKRLAVAGTIYRFISKVQRYTNRAAR